ncbi:hypothetical protein BDV95DRAFT_502708, partial [Massariosphaeria phaeospora]
RSLLESGAYSDLIITCGSDSYKVHKAVVCTQANFFARAIKVYLKEADEALVDLPEDDPSIIKLLVQYLYEAEYAPVSPVETPNALLNHLSTIIKTLRSQQPYDRNRNYCRYKCSRFICEECCPPPKHASTSSSDQLLLHAKMYKVAEKYSVTGLKLLAEEKFARAAAEYWNTADFITAAHYAFTTTVESDKGLREDAGLRDIVISTIAKSMTLITRPEIQSLMNEYQGLALQVLLEEHGWRGNSMGLTHMVEDHMVEDLEDQFI